MRGWIKFWRKTLESSVFTSLPASDFKVFMACLALANNMGRAWFNGSGEEEIPRGSFVTSQPKLADLTGLTRKQVRGALQRLEKIGSIRAKERAKRYTVVEVVNFESYQDGEEAPGQGAGLPRADAGPTLGHNVRSREVENGNHGGNEPAGGAPPGEAATNKRAKKATDPNIPLLIAYWHDTYLERFQQKPPVPGGEVRWHRKTALGRPIPR